MVRLGRGFKGRGKRVVWDHDGTRKKNPHASKRQREKKVKMEAGKRAGERAKDAN